MLNSINVRPELEIDSAPFSLQYILYGNFLKMKFNYKETYSLATTEYSWHISLQLHGKTSKKRPNIYFIQKLFPKIIFIETNEAESHIREQFFRSHETEYKNLIIETFFH